MTLTTGGLRIVCLWPVSLFECLLFLCDGIQVKSLWQEHPRSAAYVALSVRPINDGRTPRSWYIHWLQWWLPGFSLQVTFAINKYSVEGYIDTLWISHSSSDFLFIYLYSVYSVGYNPLLLLYVYVQIVSDLHIDFSPGAPGAGFCVLLVCSLILWVLPIFWCSKITQVHSVLPLLCPCHGSSQFSKESQSI